MLLLTGPAGAGKTATVHVLASELGLELQEWINPVTDTFNEGNLVAVSCLSLALSETNMCMAQVLFSR